MSFLNYLLTQNLQAYGDAASLVLEACIRPMPKLEALVAYYPPYMPKSSIGLSMTLDFLIHLPASTKWGTVYPSFRYPSTEPGFAEHDLDEYDKTAATLAWSRTLGVLRKAFGMEVDLEAIWDNHTRLGVRDQGCRCDDEDDGAAAVCEPCADDDRRDRG